MDRYTKFILTVIAACLTWLCVQAGAFVGSVNPGYADNKISIADVSVGEHHPLPVLV
jgi:hypothetical protein